MPRWTGREWPELRLTGASRRASAQPGPGPGPGPKTYDAGGVKRPSIAVQPPSTVSVEPVTNDDASEAR